MSDITFKEIADIIQKHLEERGWESNPPRGLATSIALEASELLEHYQWADEPVGSSDELGSELADIFIYAFQFAQVNNIDIPAAIVKKLDEAAKKYPAESFKGKTASQQREAWIEAKLNHKKQGL